MQITRCPENPIVWPGKWDWRRVATFNPGAIIDDDGRFYLFERACVGLRPLKCSVGLLVSDDGFHFEHVYDEPVFTADELGFPLGTIEDPRVVKMDDTYYMTFAHRPYNYNCHPTGIAVPDYMPQQGEYESGRQKHGPGWRFPRICGAGRIWAGSRPPRSMIAITCFSLRRSAAVRDAAPAYEVVR